MPLFHYPCLPNLYFGYRAFNHLYFNALKLTSWWVCCKHLFQVMVSKYTLSSMGCILFFFTVITSKICELCTYESVVYSMQYYIMLKWRGPNPLCYKTNVVCAENYLNLKGFIVFYRAGLRWEGWGVGWGRIGVCPHAPLNLYCWQVQYFMPFVFSTCLQIFTQKIHLMWNMIRKIEGDLIVHKWGDWRAGILRC